MKGFFLVALMVAAMAFGPASFSAGGAGPEGRLRTAAGIFPITSLCSGGTAAYAGQGPGAPVEPGGERQPPTGLFAPFVIGLGIHWLLYLALHLSFGFVLFVFLGLMIAASVLLVKRSRRRSVPALVGIAIAAAAGTTVILLLLLHFVAQVNTAIGRCSS